MTVVPMIPTLASLAMACASVGLSGCAMAIADITLLITHTHMEGEKQHDLSLLRRIQNNQNGIAIPLTLQLIYSTWHSKTKSAIKSDVSSIHIISPKSNTKT
jgi:hypothetical protein